MRRLIIGMTAAMALAFVGTARADDTKTTESKSTTQKSSEATKDTSPYAQDKSKEGMGGSGTTTKAEKKSTTEKQSKTDEAKTTPAK